MDMIPLPRLPDQPSAIEYFWHQLPWAVPGLLTFIVCLGLAGAGVLAIRRSQNRALLITFILFCTGFGSLGLVLASRALILDRELLVSFNQAVYFFVVWLSPGAYFFTYYLTNRAYRSLLAAGIIALGTLVFAYIGLLTGNAFSGSWFVYPFGNYPVAELPLRLWGAFSALGYLAVGIPINIHFFRTNPDDWRKKKVLFVGLHICCLLVISNLPSFVGISVFPLSTFAFVPMLILGYGIFRSDFLNLNDFLFRQRGLFNILAGLLTTGFVGLAVLTAAALPPSTHEAMYARPVFLLPLFSGVCAFALAIFLAGSNPDQKLNMLAAASLILSGVFMVVMTAFKLDLPLIVVRRLEQIFYTAFLFTPGVHLRFVYLALGKPRPVAVRLVDVVSGILCIVLWTPHFFSGFHEYWFGRISVAGPGLNAFGALGLVASCAFLYSWWSGRKSQNPLANRVVLSLVIGDLLILLNLPATSGIPLYPLAELQFIPAFILAFAVVRHGVIPVIGEATAIGTRVSFLIMLFVPASMFLYLLGLLESTPLLPAMAHVVLVSCPVALSFYLISYIFLRPTAVKMDETVRRLAEEKLRADAALASTESARREVEAVNRFTHMVNSHTDLKEIFKEISKYVYENFKIPAAWLFLPDEKEEYLVSFRAFSYKRVSDEVYDFVRKLRIPLRPEGGFTYLVWKRQKALYLPHIKKFEFEFDRQLINTTGATSFLHMPLVVKGKSIGIMIFSNVNDPMNLSKSDIRTIDTLCAQAAGVISTAYLLRQTEKEKSETAALNRLIKSLNENLDIHIIMQKVHDYVRERFGVEYFSLLAADADEKSLHLVASALPDHVSADDREHIRTLRMPIASGQGVHALALRRKRPAYFADFGSEALEWMSEDEKFILNACGIQSYLFLPLLLNRKPIGILNFSNASRSMNLTPEDIDRLSILAEQLAGIIHGSALFKEVQAAHHAAELERQKSEKLLLNILPADVASELKEKGATEPVLYEGVSVMFTDFKGFTKIAEILSPRELIQDLDACFVQFDKITERYNLEKLKTIGDSYMCAGGIPKRNKTHAIDCVLAALEIQAFMNLMKQIKEEQGLPYWELRLGIHSGPLVAGVIGERKFAYDVWGDTVNTASRMESSGTTGKINISGSTYELIKNVFDCEFRGYVSAKNKGDVAMYYVNGLKPEYAAAADSRAPNGKFWQVYAEGAA